MKKLEEFYQLKIDSDNPEAFNKHIATVVGLQPHPTRKVWVFNGSVHMDSDGTLIDPKDSPYIWLADLVHDTVLHKNRLPSSKDASSVTRSMSSQGLLKMTKALEQVYCENLPAALLMLGAQLLCMHYCGLQSIGVQVPAAIAIGNVSLGKTKSAEAALSLVGMHSVSKVKSITDSQAVKYGSLTTLGLVIDDPSHPSEVAEKLLYHFERGTRATATSSDAPRTTFITSMNNKCIEALSSMDAR